MSGRFGITAARLFDGQDRVGRATLIIDDGTIVAVGVALPADLPVVDLGDTTVLPGLVDSHLHLIFDAEIEAVANLGDTTDEEALAAMRSAARRCLRAGITTVRDLGDRGYLSLRVRDLTARDPLAGPRILAAGPPITMPRGHCWFLGGEAEGATGLRAAVAEHADRGVDVIKVMASGGDMTPSTRSHEPQYTVEELRLIVDEAHRRGLPVTAHAHATSAIRNVVTAGVDMIEHCSFLTDGGVDGDPAVIQSIVDRGIVVSSTFGVRPGAPHPPGVMERLAPRLAALSEVFGRVCRSGATVVVGSDGGVGPAKPHDLLPYSIADLESFGGLTPVDALRAATSVAARALGLPRAGRLAPGHDADLVAVAGDPITNLAALHDVTAVYRAGRLAHPSGPTESGRRGERQ